MVLELLSLAAIPTALGATAAIEEQNIFDNEAESDRRKAEFHLDVYCDAKSRKRDEVHNATVVLRNGKLYLWPKNPETSRPADLGDQPAPHEFTGFYLPFPVSDLPERPIPARPVLGLVSTIPQSSSDLYSSSGKPKLNWIYADKDTMELKYGPRVEAREHVVGPWDWTEDEEGAGLMLDGEESLVAVEEKRGGLGWALYWDPDDNRLKDYEVGRKKRVLRCSLERRMVVEIDESKLLME